MPDTTLSEYKFTIRDIFAYLFIGFYFSVLFVVFNLENDSMVKRIQNFITNPSSYNMTIIVIVGIFGLYLIGVLTHALDNITFPRSMHKYLTVKAAPKWLVLFSFHREEYANRFRIKDVEKEIQFENENKLLTNDDVNDINYWRIIHQSSEGLTLVSFVYFLASLICIDIHPYDYLILRPSVFLILTFLFWFRCVVIAKLILKERLRKSDNEVRS